MILSNSDCLIIKKSGEIGLSETLATIRQLAKTVPIPGRKRNYNLNKANETTVTSVFSEFHALLEYVHAATRVIPNFWFGSIFLSTSPEVDGNPLKYNQQLMGIQKTYEEINEKIRRGEAVVLTAEEVSQMALTASPEEIAEKVDVVTTATFGAMCSSGAIINFGHANPPIRMEKIRLNGVPAYEGLAAVDTYIGATACDTENPKYGGAHVIQDLVDGKDIELEAWGKGTDCYPRKHIKTIINKETVNEMILFNPRNAYQNYNVAVNSTSQMKYTYMGNLLPNMRNATYSTSGELSPLLNDPEMKTIGIGTRIFLGGTQGFVVWPGTQFNTSKPKNEHGVPMSNSATLAVMGNLKEMSSEFLQAAYYEKYGVSLFVGIGIPIPVLNADIAKCVSIRNEQIQTTVLDYGVEGTPALGRVTYAELRSGEITVQGKKIRTAPVSSLSKARKIAEILKQSILAGEFEISKPVQMFPTNTSLKSLKEIKGGNE